MQEYLIIYPVLCKYPLKLDNFLYPKNFSEICFVFFLFGIFRRTQEFSSFRDDTIADEGLQILTNARHSWPLSSYGSLACHTGHTFIMIMISEDP